MCAAWKLLVCKRSELIKDQVKLLRINIRISHHLFWGRFSRRGIRAIGQIAVMAQQELDSGQDIILKKFAKKIIEDQSREIKELQRWMKEAH